MHQPRLALLPLIVCLTGWLALAQAERKALTVERIYGEPGLGGRLPSNLEWSPDGKLLTYVQRDKGKAEVWAYEVATGARRLLFDSAKLPKLASPPSGIGRQPGRTYQWSPRGNELLLAAQGQLYLLKLANGEVKPLTSAKEPAEDPKFSPDGNWVSFVRAYNLYVVNLASGKETALTRDGREEWMNGTLDWVYPEELSIRTGYWWSPDSGRIAYLQMDQRPVTRYPILDFLPYRGKVDWERYPKAGDANPVVRVGVMDIHRPKAAWMDTGRDTDIYLARLDWLKDSRRVAIQRLNRHQNKLELLVADIENGRARVLLTEQDPAWVNVHDDLRFFSDGRRLLWASERDGFRHLYVYSLEGQQLAQLTRGPWMVTGVAGLDEKNQAVWFSSTRRSPLERHLERISLKLNAQSLAVSAGEPAEITRQPGTHAPLLSPDFTFFLDTYSNTATPPRMSLYRSDGSQVAVLEENRVPELADYRLSPVQFLRVAAARVGHPSDGIPLDALMVKPPDFDPSRKYPVLIHVYGGPHGQTVRNAWLGTNGLWHQMMAQKGYLVFTLDNRGMAGPARGHAFEAPIHRRFGQVELADQLEGVKYLKSLPYVDPARIGIWGWSYGGYMTCYALLNAPEVFKAGAAGAPVADWRDYDTIYTERYMGLPQQNEEGYRRSSPVNQAPQLRGRLLLVHGAADDNVHLQNTVQLVNALVKAGKRFDLMIYPGQKHGFAAQEARIHVFNRIMQFFLDSL